MMHQSFFKDKPLRSKKYLKWVSSLPSCISQLPGDDAHHIKGHGYSGTVKVSDVLSMSLTRGEHTELHTIGWKSWE